MSTTVYICEKPDQGLDYAKALNFKDLNKSKGYVENPATNTVITWGYGHLVRLYEPYEYDEKYKYTKSLDELPIIPSPFRFKVPDGEKEAYKKKQFNVIKNLLKDASEVIIATDPDREGETIGCELLELLNFKGTVNRVLAQALDAQTILKAIAAKQSASKTHNLYLAGLSRTKADWLVGINLSRAITLINRNMIDGNLPVGRILIPTVNLVYMRDKEIENFVSKEYFEMTGFFKNEQVNKLTTSWIIPEKYLDELESKCLDKKVVEDVAKKVKGKTGTVKKAEKTRKQTAAPLPFSLLELQKKCFSAFGYKGDKVLELAQSLYEKHKATTYPRTDSQYLPTAQFGEAKDVLSAIIKTDPTNENIKDLVVNHCKTSFKSKAWDDSKLTAHHGIIPTKTPANINNMSDEERNVYDMVRRHFIAQFLPLYQYDSTIIEIECEGELFKVTGSVPAIPGWKIAFDEKEKSEDELPQLKVGEKMDCFDVKVETKKTKPPARFNDSSLMEAMTDAGKYIQDPELKKILKSTKGLGTSATQANIVKNALRYGYLKEDKKYIISTEKARVLIDAAPGLIKNIETSAYFESNLEDIANGTQSPESFFSMLVKSIEKIFLEMGEGEYRVKNAIGMTYQCPKCNSGLKRLKSSKNQQYFWVCMDRENCKSIYPDNRGKPGEARKPVEQGTVEHKCTACSSKLIRREGQYGFYWKCSGESCGKNYKDVDMKPVEIEKKELTKDYPCPVCKKGFLTQRKGPKGIFWGCNNYPKCKSTKQDNGGKPEGF